MLTAVDAQYDEAEDLAGVGAVVAEWRTSEALVETTGVHRGLAEYVPGQFFRRELPAILPILRQLLDAHEIDVVLIDGYVDLQSGRGGLGRHLVNALDNRVEVIGVAKTKFRGAPAVPILRGQSRRPLWVTSTKNLERAAQRIAEMHGEARLPTLLKRTDRLAKEACQAACRAASSEGAS